MREPVPLALRPFVCRAVFRSGQQLVPKQLSGSLWRMVLLRRVTGKVVKRPPPSTVMPGLAVTALSVTVVFSRMSRGFGGGGKNTSFQIPPPSASPWGPAASAVLLLIVVLRISSSPCRVQGRHRARSPSRFGCLR